MSDTDTTPADKVLEEFDALGWLDDSQQPSDTVELYNDGPTIKAISKLTAEIEKQRQNIKHSEAQLLREPGAITDEELEVAQEVSEAIAGLREQLRGTGATFELHAVSPGEREQIEKKVEKSLKPVKAKGTFGEEDFEPAIEGGTSHPNYERALSNAMVAATIVKVTSPKGAVDSSKWTPAKVERLRESLPGIEFRRLTNKVFELYFYSYEIDTLVNADFS